MSSNSLSFSQLSLVQVLAFVLVWQALVLGGIFIFKATHAKKQHAKFLAAYMLVNAFFFFVLAFLAYADEHLKIWIFPIFAPLLLLQLPVFCWFVISSQEGSEKAVGREWVHLLPSLLIFVLQVSLLLVPDNLTLGPDGKKLLADYPHLLCILFKGTTHASFYVIFPLQFIFYTLLYRRTFYPKADFTELARTVGREEQTKKLKPYVIAISCFFLLNVFSFPLADDSGLGGFAPYLIGMMAINFFIGAYGLVMEPKKIEMQTEEIAVNQEEIAVNPIEMAEVLEVVEKVENESVPTETPHRKEESEVSKYKKSPLDPERQSSIIERLTKLMQEEELFTDTKLGIDDVAKRLEVNSKYISQSINAEYGRNFYVYINELRIEKAKRSLLADPQAHYSIEGIANQVGFQSKSAFYVSFKRLTGITPLEFRTQVIEEAQKKEG